MNRTKTNTDFHTTRRGFVRRGTIAAYGSDGNCPDWSRDLLQSFQSFVSFSITCDLWVFLEYQKSASQRDAGGPCSCKEQVKRGSAQGLDGEFWVPVPFLLGEDLAERFEWQS